MVGEPGFRQVWMQFVSLSTVPAALTGARGAAADGSALLSEPPSQTATCILELSAPALTEF